MLIYSPADLREIHPQRGRQVGAKCPCSRDQSASLRTDLAAKGFLSFLVVLFPRCSPNLSRPKSDQAQLITEALDSCKADSTQRPMTTGHLEVSVSLLPFYCP
jgi:hypothetical protein